MTKKYETKVVQNNTFIRNTNYYDTVQLILEEIN